MVMLADVTAALVGVGSLGPQHQNLLEIPAHIKSMMPGISQRINCRVEVHSLFLDKDTGRTRLTLKLSPSIGKIDDRTARMMLRLSVADSPVIMERVGKELRVTSGSGEFLSHCCRRVKSVLKGLARDYDEIAFICSLPASMTDIAGPAFMCRPEVVQNNN